MLLPSLRQMASLWGYNAKAASTVSTVIQDWRGSGTVQLLPKTGWGMGAFVYSQLLLIGQVLGAGEMA